MYEKCFEGAEELGAELYHFEKNANYYENKMSTPVYTGGGVLAHVENDDKQF
jgi:hypothetical protein